MNETTTLNGEVQVWRRVMIASHFVVLIESSCLANNWCPSFLNYMIFSMMFVAGTLFNVKRGQPGTRKYSCIDFSLNQNGGRIWNFSENGAQLVITNKLSCIPLLFIVSHPYFCLLLP